MKGSEKQIAWANKIKNEFIEKIQKIVEYAKDRSNRDSMPKEYYKIVFCLQDKVLKIMDSWSAEDFINNRFDLNFEYNFIKLYENTINSDKKKEKLEILYKELTENK